MGSYHGYYSFRAFSHQRIIARVSGWLERTLHMRYMPYSFKELDRYRILSLPKPNFDQDGNPITGLRYWLGIVLSLGGKSSHGKSSHGTALRWGLLFSIFYVMGLRKSLPGM